MKLIIAGGGTGGHLFPGVAIAEELKARDPSAEILFVGTARGIEARVLPRLGWPLALIKISGLKTVGILGAIKGLIRIPLALWQSLQIVRRIRPDAVIGVGGYASGPVVLAAWLCRVPTAILEQNSIPGLANKILGRIVRNVFLSFEHTRVFFAAKRILMTGNPIRADLQKRLDSHKETIRDPNAPFRVFCFGGSLGARAVNNVMVEATMALKEQGKPPHVVHQTGKDDREAVALRYQAAGIPADVLEFIDDMASEYARADLVISRAGATTVAELTAIGRPAILIPYPFAADDHQAKNASELQRAGAAVVFRQADVDGPRLAASIRDLMDNRATLGMMGAAMKALGRPNAACAIVDWIIGQARA
ncbi:MAG: undecaprenyldiphospho-muramoylpentapeptide beta-N-acetylglucosaminyltransferase [Deltaproteobacteria bacterium]|nr:undecaprenyldiphospho-muramoylpentapeptide beta-N-acetylglucosaminyltransferase [Deltaproteobacteria bacterium]